MIKLKNLILEGEEADGYYYHVTLAPYISSIQKNGLRVRGNKATVSNYREYSHGKIFLCDIGGLDFWVWKIGEHGFSNFDEEKFHEVAIFRIDKNKLENVEVDSEGSRDSRGNAYFVNYDIPANVIEFVRIEEEPF